MSDKIDSIKLSFHFNIRPFSTRDVREYNTSRFCSTAKYYNFKIFKKIIKKKKSKIYFHYLYYLALTFHPSSIVIY